MSFATHIKNQIRYADLIYGYERPPKTATNLYSETSPTHIISFCTTNWPNAILRFTTQQSYIRKHFNFFKSYIQYTEHDLGEDFLHRASSAKDTSKYYYFQSWKPYLISKRLTEIPDGDRLFYIDAGCTFPHPDTLQSFLDRIIHEYRKIEKSKSIFGLPVNREYAKCCAAGACNSALDFYSLKNDERFLYSFPHYENGMMLMINNQQTRDFVRKWSDTMLDNLNILFSDIKHGQKHFVQSSHDQITMQAMLYIEKLKVTDISDLCYGYNAYARCRG